MRPIDKGNNDGKPATEAQIRKWLERFPHYRMPPTRETLVQWLRRFEPDDLNIAHKILDQVIMVSELQIQEGYKSGLEALEGWSKSAEERQGRWFFVGVGEAGESGLAMLRLFRDANGLTRPKWQGYFVTLLDLPELRLSAFDNIVFVDDFAGTGVQMVEYWPTLEELVASEAKCFLLLTVLTMQAEAHIVKHTDLLVRAHKVLGSEENIFSADCGTFTEHEKAVLDNYGEIAWPPHPRGYGDCGLCVVLSHKTPNNTIPILHANHPNWIGLFPRYLIAEE